MVHLEDMCGNLVRITSVKPDGSFDADISTYTFSKRDKPLLKDFGYQITPDCPVELSLIFEEMMETEGQKYLVRIKRGNIFPQETFDHKFECYEFLGYDKDRGVVRIKQVKDEEILDKLRKTFKESHPYLDDLVDVGNCRVNIRRISENQTFWLDISKYSGRSLDLFPAYKNLWNDAVRPKKLDNVFEAAVEIKDRLYLCKFSGEISYDEPLEIDSCYELLTWSYKNKAVKLRRVTSRNLIKKIERILRGIRKDILEQSLDEEVEINPEDHELDDVPSEEYEEESPIEEYMGTKI